ncbi:predicted protein [Lichtheimia corymbifera JMRC:FSU:9682]|uniref:Uncharacterized protein n=1 Tax=Lichtheimia corymbifera JMRC:FSU:9682 TaxID=1263082 RepID=A0A068SGC7_9FUNG|nr:predicted protein [Lichtheimia corymbifera JMRC:FSU:9682]
MIPPTTSTPNSSTMTSHIKTITPSTYSLTAPLLLNTSFIQFQQPSKPGRPPVYHPPRAVSTCRGRAECWHQACQIETEVQA